MDDDLTHRYGKARHNFPQRLLDIADAGQTDAELLQMVPAPELGTPQP